MINIAKKGRGFTIVELLVVIVVIGILAAITLVSYNGITARSNTASAQSAANSLMGKIEAYNVDTATGGFPATFSALTADSTKSYYISTVTLAPALLAAKPADPEVVNYIKCGTNGTATPPTTAALITVLTGYKVGYWDYSLATPAIAYYTNGAISGNWLTFPIACFPSLT